MQKKKYNEKYGVEAAEEDYGLLVIHPDECINCGACETECPVEAIYEDTAVPEQDEEFIKINEDETINLSDDELDQCRCTSKAA
mgnify:FL=1